jgi:hypothetical protein
MSIEAIPTDESGLPTIPAEQAWMEAATHHLAWKAARKRWLADALTDKKYQIIERDRDWYFAQAVNQSKIPQNVDQMESLKNTHLITIPDIQAHAAFFANMQIPEMRKFRGTTNNRVSVTPTKITQSPDNLAN